MAGKLVSFPFKVGYWLICLSLIAALAGCAPNIPITLSDEDLQTCDATAATIREQFNFPVSQYEVKTYPYLTTPPLAIITSPLNGSILPFAKVKISFTQPAPDPSVLARVLRVFVTPIDSVNLSAVYHYYEPYVAISSSMNNPIDYYWTPNSSGKFIILVLFHNLKQGGNPGGGPKNDFGPASVAYVCVKIDPPKAGDIIIQQPGTVVPVQNITVLVPTITKTLTLTPTMTSTFTFTPTFTATLPPTFTFTPLKPTFTSTKTPTLVRPTDIPPTPVIVCEGMDQRTCESHNDVCKWEPPVTGGPEICQPK